MTVYKSIAHAVGTPEALALAAQLSAWHDTMVAHQRPARQAASRVAMTIVRMRRPNRSDPCAMASSPRASASSPIIVRQGPWIYGDPVLSRSISGARTQEDYAHALAHRSHARVTFVNVVDDDTNESAHEAGTDVNRWQNVVRVSLTGQPGPEDCRACTADSS